MLLGGGALAGLGAGIACAETPQEASRSQDANQHPWTKNRPEGKLVRSYEPSRDVVGLFLAAPSTVAVGEEFRIGVRVLSTPYTAPLFCFTTDYPTVSSSTNLSPRGISYMDNVPPDWRGKLLITSSEGYMGPAEVSFADGKGPYPHDSRPIRRIGPMQFNTPGIHFVTLTDPETGVAARSNPIEVSTGAPELRLYWGDIHGHTILTDAIRSPEEYYYFARDEAFLDICALSDHAEVYLTDRQWDYLTAVTNDFNAPGRFATLVAQEWTSRYGHRNLYHRNSKAPRIRATDPQYEQIDAMYAFARKHGALVIPHHSASADMGVNWELGHDPELERLVEIYSCWGSSERPGEAGNPRPIHADMGGERMGQHICDAMRLGRRYGFIGSGDVHDGRPGNVISHWQAEPLMYRSVQPGGLLAVWCPKLARHAVFDALWNRRVYATTGARILLRFEIAGQPMGGEVRGDGPLTASVMAASEIPVASVELVKNGEDYASRDVGDCECRCEFEINAGSETDSYYVRVTRQDGEMAWSSPVWVRKT